MPIVPLAIAAGIGAVGAGVVSAVSAASAKKAATISSTPTPDASQTVGDATTNQTSQANNLGRAALISTSPSGVQGIDPTGRRKLIGDD